MSSTTARAAASLDEALAAWRDQQRTTLEYAATPDNPPGVNTDRRVGYPNE
jgi:hypothetical protein